MKEIDKVRVLLPHLIEHSRSHEQEFAKWAAVLGTNGRHEAAALMNEAIGHLQSATKGLEDALKKLGGPLKGKSLHEHPHD